MFHLPSPAVCHEEFWCDVFGAVQTQSLFCFSIQCLNYKRLADSSLQLIYNGFIFPLWYHNHYAITNSGPYTRKFTMSLLRSFKLSRNHKTNGSLEKQSRRSAFVSMLWSPLPLSVTLLCGHSQAWFGYACRMRRTGKKSCPMNVTVQHAWSHTRMVSFEEDAFSPRLL